MKTLHIFMLCLILIGLGSAQSQSSDKTGHETYVYAQNRFVAGSTAAIRVMVKRAVSLTENVPVPGANILVTLQVAGELQVLYEGKTEADGNADVRFEVPYLPEGSHILNIYTSSQFGKEKIQQAIQVDRKEKILLITDKPMYQPSQTIHIRALSLEQMTLKPLRDKEILFEVEDSKGNKVFKQRMNTDEYGIASVPFLLAEEVNTGNYRILATLASNKAEKVVTVEKYVLPKFKLALTTEKQYFMPYDFVKGKVQGDYFFGKPVSGGKVKLIASTFDVAFREFFRLEGTLGEDGSFGFEFRLPEYFAGQPLEQGNAVVKLEAEITDKANHSEKKTITLPVSNQAIRIAVVPEGGKLVPEVLNQIFVVTSYPDGSPASTKVTLSVLGNDRKEALNIQGQTDETGIATLAFVPKAELMIAGNVQSPREWRRWGRRWNRNIKQTEEQIPENVLSAIARVQDQKGTSSETNITLSSIAKKDAILLRPGQTIYKSGETIAIDMFATFATGTVYLDILKDGQTVLTKTVDLVAGQGKCTLEATSSLFGTIVAHAYKLIEDGTYARATRRFYVHPASDVKITITPDKIVYRPGEKATIAFLTTDQKDNPVPAALGISIVDEAVYALQEMQPGLEKVYFTLEKEIMEPKYQIQYGPRESLPVLIREQTIRPSQQKAAAIFFSRIEPVSSYAWEVNPQTKRIQEFQARLFPIFDAIVKYVRENSISRQYLDGRWACDPNLLQGVVDKKYMQADMLKDSYGNIITLDMLVKADSSFSYNVLARLETASKIGKAYKMLEKYWESSKRGILFWKSQRDLGSIPLNELTQSGKLAYGDSIDGWGNPLKLQVLVPQDPEMKDVSIYSAGPDGKFDTEDDIHSRSIEEEMQSSLWRRQGVALQYENETRMTIVREEITKHRKLEVNRDFGAIPEAMEAKGIPEPMKMPAPGGMDVATGGGMPTNTSTTAEPPKVREYFPETLLFEPRLITDKDGKSSLHIDMADSITTWRLTASANTKTGLLGGTTSSLRVFQDFFVDIDFPVALTQNDEVSVPVAIYNYLATEQKIRLLVEKEPWFELLDEPEKWVSMNARDVGVTYFRVRAKDIGYHRLTITAYGTKMSDAVRRQVEIVPNGKRIENSVNGHLSKDVEHAITIPQYSIPGASKILVKCYPGIGAVLVEGLDGMLRLPGG